MALCFMREAPAGVLAQMTGRVIGCASGLLELMLVFQMDPTSVSKNNSRYLHSQTNLCEIFNSWNNMQSRDCSLMRKMFYYPLT